MARAHRIQLIGSLLAAAAIVAIAIVVVTARLGPDADDDRSGGDRDRTEQSDGGHGRR